VEVDTSDLIGGGYLGLVRAVERFDPGRGYKFATFAQHRIRGGILDQLRSEGTVIRIKGRQELESRTRCFTALDAELWSEDGPYGLAFDPEDPGTSPERSVDLDDLFDFLRSKLSCRDWHLLIGTEAYSQVSVARGLGLSESRVCQIRGKLLKKSARILRLAGVTS